MRMAFADAARSVLPHFGCVPRAPLGLSRVETYKLQLPPSHQAIQSLAWPLESGTADRAAWNAVPRSPLPSSACRDPRRQEARRPTNSTSQDGTRGRTFSSFSESLPEISNRCLNPNREECPAGGRPISAATPPLLSRRPPPTRHRLPGAGYTPSVTRGRLLGALAAVAIAATLGVLVAGRGGASPVSAAAAKTSGASARLVFTLTLRGPGGTVRVDGSGVVEGANADLSVRASGAPAAFPTALHALLVRQGGHDLGTLAAAGSALTPARVLDLLRQAGASVENLGSATVGGAETTHYRVGVDLAELAQAAGLPQLLSGRLGRLAAQQVPVDVWIGTDGLLHRISLDVRHGSRDASFEATLARSTSAVAITAPPSSDVLDATTLLAGLGAGA